MRIVCRTQIVSCLPVFQAAVYESCCENSWLHHLASFSHASSAAQRMRRCSAREPLHRVIDFPSPLRDVASMRFIPPWRYSTISHSGNRLRSCASVGVFGGFIGLQPSQSLPASFDTKPSPHLRDRNLNLNRAGARGDRGPLIPSGLTPIRIDSPNGNQWIWVHPMAFATW